MSKVADQMLDLRQKSVEDLKKLYEDHRAELFALKFQAAVGSLEQTHKIKLLRRSIARIETLLKERAKAGEVVTKVIKPDYAKAVESAEQAGKEVRKKQRELIEKMQQEQYGAGSALDNDAIAAAMAAASVEDNSANQVVEVEAKKPASASKPAKSESVKEEKPAKEAAAPKAAKSTATKEAAPKTAKPAASAKKAASSSDDKIEPLLTKEPAKAKSPKAKAADVEPKEVPHGKTTAKVTKPKAVENKEPVSVETGEAKATGKGKAALGEVKTKTIKIDSVKGENIEGIELKLAKKPKQVKTYTYGSNVTEVKKQLEETSKKQEAKKTVKKTDKGAK
ncbi:50S ribosomal protein L29 [Spiroplasma helicoides]|uniref:Large ribosomal subunit protein uL29 n=1 Tax=Spiroplasma helicoides TaxID=216938 RepID=A0A1B3SLK2_9MOLU|nr:50S ribosomal protein L29 [Spiroplasma helicoides]AOG60815.1 50S ribosomal protein L29 [Spiroplasma helicoides]